MMRLNLRPTLAADDSGQLQDEVEGAVVHGPLSHCGGQLTLA